MPLLLVVGVEIMALVAPPAWNVPAGSGGSGQPNTDGGGNGGFGSHSNTGTRMGGGGAGGYSGNGGNAGPANGYPIGGHPSSPFIPIPSCFWTSRCRWWRWWWTKRQ